MTRIGLAGDWHGNTLWARHAIATFGMHDIGTVIHLGDLGLGWPGEWNQYLSEVEGACTRWGVTLYVTPGNHENYAWMLENLGPLSVYTPGTVTPQRVSDHAYVLPRGHRMERDGRTILSLGGAPSIDFLHRVEGMSWWREEMITLAEAEAVAADGHADIMLAHDAPDGGTDQVQAIIDTPPHLSMWTDRGLRYAREGRELMNIAVAGVKPKVFAHGHYHVAGEKQTEVTKYLSLNCDGMHLNIAALDLETLEHEWLDILRVIPESK